MLRVTIELVPYGDEERAHDIAVMLIANDGTGDSEVGNYVYAYTHSNNMAAREAGVIIQHVRSFGAWALVKAVLEDYDYYEGGNELTDYLLDRLDSYIKNGGK